VVWEIYCRKDGLVYVVCDGYGDFLREPASPDIFNERFYPWYALVFNECDDEKELFPPSDVRLMRDMQLEYNRCREGSEGAAHRGSAVHRGGERRSRRGRPRQAVEREAMPSSS
jgi:hypothetical protein